jgi:hypothetical protein
MDGGFERSIILLSGLYIYILSFTGERGSHHLPRLLTAVVQLKDGAFSLTQAYAMPENEEGVESARVDENAKVDYSSWVTSRTKSYDFAFLISWPFFPLVLVFGWLWHYCIWYALPVLQLKWSLHSLGCVCSTETMCELTRFIATDGMKARKRRRGNVFSL